MELNIQSSGDVDQQINPNAENYERPYNHLIDEEADQDLFHKTFTEKESNIVLDSSTSSAKERTGLVCTPDCINHYCLWDENYEENPRRYKRTFERLKELGLIEKCFRIKPRRATKKEIQLVHSEEYVNKVSEICSHIDPEQLEKSSSQYDAVYFSPSTYECALYAAGSVIEMVEHIINGKITNGFALVRPPGHHALQDKACGYCIFNNIAIATKYCLNKYKMKRILIVDWDVHHGQATQRCFYNDSRVLYISLHRYENGAFWPELIESNYNFMGHDNALGYNLNVPLNDIGLCDTDYLSIWHNLLLPIFYEFNPELVLVSAGYDTAIGCPEGEMLLTPSIYGHLTHYLMGLANGKIGIVMEGGYCIESLCDGVAFTVKALLGDAPIPLKMKYPINQTVVESVLNVISVHRTYWDMLKLQKTFNRHEPDDKEESRKRHYPMLEYQGLIGILAKPQSYPTRNCYPIQSKEVVEKYSNAILTLRNYAFNISNGYSKKRTCLITLPEDSRRHSAPKTHPERPSRISFTWRFLKTSKILDRCFIIKDNRREATEEQILKCHSKEAINKVRCTEHKDYKDLREYENLFDSVYFTSNTFKIAQQTVGALLQVVDCVLQNKCLNGFACIRPPGHHACKDFPAGFCIFNNISIAAHYAFDQYKLNRILIVDWDVHHGDGTQNIVQNDDRILFISLHRYDHASFYPEKSDSNYSIGKNIINIPWNGGPMGDKEYLAAFFNIVMPIAYNFNPELVLISAGFDAAQGDPLGEYQLSPKAYGQMTHMLCSLANGKVIMSLEGGYNLRSIADSVLECILVLLGDPPKPLNFERKLDESSYETMMNVIDYHSSFWPCFAFNIDIPDPSI